MPDVRNCRKCGKVYTYLGGNPICPACKQLDEEDFKKVKDYLYRNPGAGLSQVSVDLEISVDKIKRFLKEGRLEIVSQDGNLFLECEGCGKAINSGRFCDECERELASNFRSTANQMKSELNGMSESARKTVGMRYLNKDDGRKV